MQLKTAETSLVSVYCKICSTNGHEENQVCRPKQCVNNQNQSQTDRRRGNKSPLGGRKLDGKRELEMAARPVSHINR